MHILVTGGTGFIGRAVIRAALAQKHRVTALVRSLDKAKSLLPQDNPDLTFLAVNDLSGFDAATAPSYDRLIHLAWAEVGKYTDPGNLTLNLQPQFEFLSKVATAGLRDITVAGTCLEYGMVDGAAQEDAAVKPVTFYGLAKSTLYQMLLLAGGQYPDLRLKWARFFYVYGLGQRPQSLLSQLLAAIERKDAQFNMSQGDQVRDFIHIDTIAHNLLAIAVQQEQTGVINLGNGVGVRVIDFVNRIRDIKGSEIVVNRGFYPYPVYEPFSFFADIKKLKAVAGAKFDEQIRL